MTNMKGQQALIAVIILIVSAVVGMSIINAIMTTTTNLSTGAMVNKNITGAGITLTPIGYAVETGTVVVINNSDGATVASSQLNINYATGVLNSTLGSQGTDSLKNITWNYMDKGGYSNSLSRTIGTYLVPLGLLGVLAMAVAVAL